MTRIKICPTKPWSHFYNLPLPQTTPIQTINSVIISQQLYLAIICFICSLFVLSVAPLVYTFPLSHWISRTHHSIAQPTILAAAFTAHAITKSIDLLSLHYFRLLPWPRTPFLLTKISWSLNQTQISITTPSTPGYFQRKRLP